MRGLERSGRLLAASTVALVASTAVAVGGSTAAAAPEGCPELHVFAVQGTGQSAPDAPENLDTGFLAQLFNQGDFGGRFARSYIPYQASFGGATSPNPTPYSESVLGGVKALDAKIGELHQRCPSARIGIVGYSQGAHVASSALRQLGSGSGPVRPEAVAFGALFGDPTRKEGAKTFPGAANQSHPAAVPGTTGAAVSGLSAPDLAPPTGGGIGPVADVAADFGSLSGRVASFCAAGDLACDTPKGSAVARVVTNLVGQSKLDPKDPIAAIASISEAVALSSLRAGGTILAEDVSGSSLAELSYNPKKSLSERLVEATDPRTPVPDLGQILNRVGTIGFNAIETVVRKTFTPSTIMELAAVGLANPPAALAVLGVKLADALVELVPPATQNRLTQQAFEAVSQLARDNASIPELITASTVAATIVQHGNYGSVPITPNGQSAVDFTRAWMKAVLDDLGGAGAPPQAAAPTAASTSASTTPSSSATSTPSVTSPSTSSLAGAR